MKITAISSATQHQNFTAKNPIQGSTASKIFKKTSFATEGVLLKVVENPIYKGVARALGIKC